MSLEVPKEIKWAIGRGLLGIPDHLLDRIKTEKQTNGMHKLSNLQLAFHIYRAKGGVWGLFAGFIPQLSQSFLKQSGSFWMMQVLPPYFQRTWHLRREQALLATSQAITFAEVGLTPFENLKNRLMTREQNGKGTLKKLAHSLSLQQAYRGGGVVFLKKEIVWNSLVLGEDFTRKYFFNGKRHLNLSEIIPK